MVKIFIASFNRASDGAISKLVEKMKKEDIYIDNYDKADYILACGDRQETFDFVVDRFREGKKIIHLWAGDISQGTLDEVYRHSITMMSCVQLCTNDHAKNRVKSLCKAIDKQYFVITVGNVMLDNMEIDESLVPDKNYDVILYNPPTATDTLRNELSDILSSINNNYIWIEPNGDPGSEEIMQYVNTKNLPREKFLGLLKNCDRFITNSSSQFYEAPFVMDKEDIVSIGLRNKDRESKYSDMTIDGASDRIIKVFKELL